MIDRRHPTDSTRVTPEQAELLRPRLAQFRLLLAALLAGVVIFAGIAIAFGDGVKVVWPPSMLSLILAGLSVGVALQAFILPLFIRRTASSKLSGDTPERISRLSGIWFSSSLVGAALLESGAMLNIVACILERNTLHIALAGLYAAMMSVHLPTMNRLLDWIDSNLSAR